MSNDVIYLTSRNLQLDLLALWFNGTIDKVTMI